MVVFKPLQEPSLSSVQVLDRVGNNGCVGGTIHGSENEVRAPPGAGSILLLRCLQDPAQPWQRCLCWVDLGVSSVTLLFPPLLLEISKGDSTPVPCKASCHLLGFCPPPTSSGRSLSSFWDWGERQPFLSQVSMFL